MIKRFRRMLPALLAVLSVLILAACNATDKALTGISIDTQGRNLTLVPGDELQLAARAANSSAPVSASWHSSQPGVATVDKDGLVIAIAVGETIITASSSVQQQLKDQVTITVEAAEPGNYRLNTKADGGGSVSRDPEEPSYVQGTQVTLTAEADQGWYFEHWTGDVDDTSENPVVLQMDGHKTVTAVFRQIVMHDVQVNTIGNGEVAGFSPGPYRAGTELRLTAEADEGWIFDGWTGDVLSTDNPLEIMLDRDVTLTARFSYAVCAGDELVTFEDRTVEERVRTLFGISGNIGEPIICSQVQQRIPSRPDPDNDGQELANRLILNRCGAEPITSLEGLQHLVHLARLELSCNELEDISQLAGLTGLVELNLDNNLVSDLTPLAVLHDLEVLGLYANEVESLNGLEGLVNLRILYLSENRISDLRPLTGLHKLEHLWLYLNCSIVERAPDGLPLTIEGCLTDISPVAQIPSLVSLLLGINDVVDLSPLSNLTNLQMLHAAGNGISNIDPLRELPRLRTALLDSNYLTNLSGLADNPHFAAGVRPFVFKRGSVELILRADPNGDRVPLPNLTLGENCLDLNDPEVMADLATLTEHLEVIGFEESVQSQAYWCDSHFAAQSFQPGQARSVSSSMNNMLRELRQSRSR